jgi:hypothetical protein
LPADFELVGADATNCSDGMAEGSDCFPTCKNESFQRVGGFKCSGGSLKGISYCIEVSEKNDLIETNMVQASFKFTITAGCQGEDVRSAIIESLAATLGVNPEQLIKVKVFCSAGRRLGLLGRSLVESSEVRVDYIVAVPEGSRVQEVVQKSTSLIAKFDEVMQENNVDVQNVETVFAAVVFRQPMVANLTNNPFAPIDVHTQTTTAADQVETDAAIRSPALIVHVLVLQVLAWVMRHVL